MYSCPSGAPSPFSLSAPESSGHRTEGHSGTIGGTAPIRSVTWVAECASISRRFMFRAEYRSYVVFTSRNDNEEIDEWRGGFAFFF